MIQRPSALTARINDSRICPSGFSEQRGFIGIGSARFVQHVPASIGIASVPARQCGRGRPDQSRSARYSPAPQWLRHRIAAAHSLDACGGTCNRRSANSSPLPLARLRPGRSLAPHWARRNVARELRDGARLHQSSTNGITHKVVNRVCWRKRTSVFEGCTFTSTSAMASR